MEQGAYSERGVVGVYVSPEAAMAAHPGGWQPCPYAEPGYQWDNGLDWSDSKTITRYELQGERLEPTVEH